MKAVLSEVPLAFAEIFQNLQEILLILETNILNVCVMWRFEFKIV